MSFEYGSIELKKCVKPSFALPSISRNDFNKLVEQVYTEGILTPIVINRRDNMVLCGYWVVRACGVLEGRFPGKYSKLDVAYVDLSESEAVAFGMECRKLGREAEEQDIIEVLCELDVEDLDSGTVHDFFEDIPEEDLSEFDELVDFEDDMIDNMKVDHLVGDEEFFVSVRCGSVEEQSFLFDELRGRGYFVRKSVF